MDARPLVLVSNRGPLSYDQVGDDLVARRGAGGLVSGLAPLMAGTDRIWIAAALSDGDRAAAADGLRTDDALRVQLLDIDPAMHRAAYDVVCNSTLWFLHHHLYDLALRPRFDQKWHEAWAAQRAVTATFADAVAATAPRDAVVLVQDYHLCLLPPLLRAARPDVAIVHFSHTPFAAPEVLSVLPDEPRTELLAAMADADACGFHSERWAESLRRSCAVDGIEPPRTFVAPLAPDVDDLRRASATPACETALAALDASVGDQQLIVRVDRVELSKNLLRGFDAFDRLLELFPHRRGTVVLGAFLYPSREGLPEYLAYRQQVEQRIERIVARWGTDEWTPIIADLSDDFPTSVAALRRADVLLVNPVRDGLNLVATEGPLLNERDASLLLSPQAGVWDQLAELVDRVHPFDVEATAEALETALSRDPDERAVRAAALRAVAGARTPRDWLADQLAAVS